MCTIVCERNLAVCLLHPTAPISDMTATIDIIDLS